MFTNRGRPSQEKLASVLASLGKWVRLRDESAKQLITLSEDWGAACSNGNQEAASVLLPDLKGAGNSSEVLHRATSPLLPSSTM